MILQCWVLVQLAGGAGRAAGGWSEQGLQPLLPALQLDTTGLGVGRGKGPICCMNWVNLTLPGQAWLSMQNQSLL